MPPLHPTSLNDLRNALWETRWSRLRFQLLGLSTNANPDTQALSTALLGELEAPTSASISSPEGLTRFNHVSRLACRLLPPFAEPAMRILLPSLTVQPTWMTTTEHPTEPDRLHIADRLTPIHWVRVRFADEPDALCPADFCQQVTDALLATDTSISAQAQINLSAQYANLLAAQQSHPLIDWLAETSGLQKAVPLSSMDTIKAIRLHPAEWELAQRLLPNLEAGLLISATRTIQIQPANTLGEATSLTERFAQVRETPVCPWVAVQTGWLWQLAYWQSGIREPEALLKTDALLRQSMETAYLHQMLQPSPEAVGSLPANTTVTSP